MGLFDLSELKNDTAKKKYVRKETTKVLIEPLKKRFGDENVIYIPKAIYPNDGGKIDSESIAIRVADVEDKDGYTVDYIIIVSPQAKAFNTVMRKDGKVTKSLNLDDIREAVETIKGAKRD